jgi:hypothetical protein
MSPKTTKQKQPKNEDSSENIFSYSQYLQTKAQYTNSVFLLKINNELIPPYQDKELFFKITGLEKTTVETIESIAPVIFNSGYSIAILENVQIPS